MGEYTKLGRNFFEVALAQVNVDGWYFPFAYFIGQAGLHQLDVERV